MCLRACDSFVWSRFGEGNDRIDGGLGADVMTGGTGGDLNFVDEAGDRVLEMPGEGTDTVYTKVSYNAGGRRPDRGPVGQRRDDRPDAGRKHSHWTASFQLAHDHE